MKKIRKPKKQRNPIALELTDPMYRTRVVPSKKEWKFKKKDRRDDYDDYEDDDYS